MLSGETPATQGPEQPNTQTWAGREELSEQVAKLLHSYCEDDWWTVEYHPEHEHMPAAEAIIDHLFPWEWTER